MHLLRICLFALILSVCVLVAFSNKSCVSSFNYPSYFTLVDLSFPTFMLCMSVFLSLYDLSLHFSDATASRSPLKAQGLLSGGMISHDQGGAVGSYLTAPTIRSAHSLTRTKWLTLLLCTDVIIYICIYTFSDRQIDNRQCTAATCDTTV